MSFEDLRSLLVKHNMEGYVEFSRAIYKFGYEEGLKDRVRT